MSDEAHIRLVDPHAERDGRHHDGGRLPQKPPLPLRAQPLLQAGVVGGGVDPLLRQPGGGLIGPPAGAHVDDAGLARVLVPDEGQQLAFAVGFQLHPVADVRPVEARHEVGGVGQLELGEDVPARLCVGGGRQRDPRDPGEPPRHLCDLEVLRPEVVAPLRYAVRLVDREQGDRDFLKQPLKSIRQQPLGRDVQQVRGAGQQPRFNAPGVGGGKAGVQIVGAQPVLLQSEDLVLHEGDQRRDHDADAGAQDRGDLIADGLAASGRHQHERVLPAHHPFDDVQLMGAERPVAVESAQDVVRRRR